MAKELRSQKQAALSNILWDNFSLVFWKKNPALRLIDFLAIFKEFWYNLTKLTGDLQMPGLLL